MKQPATPDSGLGAPASPEAGGQTARKLRVLVVDDEESVRALLSDVLVRLGHAPTACGSGPAAIELAGRQQFDAVFLDVQMPGMDGAEALIQLRVLLPDAAFVVITGYMSSPGALRTLENGADLCLTKPVSISVVADLLQDIARESGESDTVQPPSR